MYKDKKFIAVIPARSGSKGIPEKNIKPLAGKPLIAYTIEEAKKSKIFDKIIVSTDSEKIAKIAKDYGAEVPFLRPVELATDSSDSMDVVIHAIEFLEKNNKFFNYVMKLQPTSPLRKDFDIIEAAKLAIEKNANSVISVSECKNHPLWAGILEKDRRMDNFLKDEIKNKNRQELPKYYELNGMIFLAKIEKLLETRDWYMKNSYALIVDKNRSVDIDDIIDFKLAEIIIKEMNKRSDYV